MEANLQRGQELIAQVINGWDRSRPMCSWELNREIGRRLLAENQMPSILGCAYRRDVPVYVPALTDSEVGLGISREILARDDSARRPVRSGCLLLRRSPCTIRFWTCTTTRGASWRPNGWGFLPSAGGVPRNWAQQVGPFRRHHQPAARRRTARAAIPLCRAHLPGTGPLGRPERLHVYRRRVVGQVCQPRGRGPLRRGPLRRHHRLAAVGASDPGDEGGRGMK